MTRLEPAAFLTVDGVDVARSTVAGTPTDLLALDGLAVTWGRTEALDQQEPATASVRLFDPARSWHRSREWIGVPVRIRWELTHAGVTTVRTIFRGRISRINPVLSTVGGVRGSLVTLDLTSIITDLGNVLPTADWPAESLAQRRSRLSAAAVAAGITAGVTTRTDWDAFAANIIAGVDQESIWTHLVQLFDALADRLNYTPEANAITAVGSRDYRTARCLGRLSWDPPGGPSDRAGQGVFARARVLNNGAGTYLDGREAGYPDDAGVSRDTTSAISRIRWAGADLIASVEVRGVYERVVAGANESLTGIRALNVETGVSTTMAQLSLDRWELLVRTDAAAWQLEPVVVRTAVTGGFEELLQLQTLLVGHEFNTLVFFQATELPLISVPPVFGVMGGTIAHRDGHWEVDYLLAPVQLAARQHPVTWEDIDDGTPDYAVQLWDDPHPHGLHDSLTFEDLRWVGIGLRATETGYTIPDYGWDFYA